MYHYPAHKLRQKWIVMSSTCCALRLHRVHIRVDRLLIRSANRGKQIHLSVCVIIAIMAR